MAIDTQSGQRVATTLGRAFSNHNKLRLDLATKLNATKHMADRIILCCTFVSDLDDVHCYSAKHPSIYAVDWAHSSRTSTQRHKSAAKAVHYCRIYIATVHISSRPTHLHCVLAAVQCIVMGPVCGFVCLRVCYHDNSKLRASIFTKLGL